MGRQGNLRQSPRSLVHPFQRRSSGGRRGLRPSPRLRQSLPFRPTLPVDRRRSLPPLATLRQDRRPLRARRPLLLWMARHRLPRRIRSNRQPGFFSLHSPSLRPLAKLPFVRPSYPALPAFGKGLAPESALRSFAPLPLSRDFSFSLTFPHFSLPLPPPPPWGFGGSAPVVCPPSPLSRDFTFSSAFLTFPPILVLPGGRRAALPLAPPPALEREFRFLLTSPRPCAMMGPP